MVSHLQDFRRKVGRMLEQVRLFSAFGITDEKESLLSVANANDKGIVVGVRMRRGARAGGQHT